METQGFCPTLICTVACLHVRCQDLVCEEMDFKSLLIYLFYLRDDINLEQLKFKTCVRACPTLPLLHAEHV